MTAHRLLSQIKKIPGIGVTGTIDAAVLAMWLDEVRHLCGEYGRGVVVLIVDNTIHACRA